MRASVNNKTNAENKLESPLFDQRFENAIGDLEPYFMDHLKNRISKVNALAIVDYILSTKVETNLSTNYRRGIITSLKLVSEFCDSEYTLYRNTTTRLLNKFGAKYKHAYRGGSITFKLDKQRVERGSKSRQVFPSSKYQPSRHICGSPGPGCIGSQLNPSGASCSPSGHSGRGLGIIVSLAPLGALPFFVPFSSTLAQEETEAASEKNMPTGYVDAALYDKSNRLIIMDDAGFVDVSTLPSDDISIGVNIDLELWEEVKKAAIDENITVTEFLEEALRDRLAKAEAGE